MTRESGQTAHHARRRIVAVAVGAGLLAGLTGAQLASAVTAGATRTVNIKTAPSASKTTVGGLVRGQRITAVSEPKSGWVKVRFAGRSAYVAASQLNTTGKNLPATPTKINTGGTKITTAALNVRSGPSISAAVVGRIAEGTRVRLTGKLGGGYAQTRYAGKLRWVSVAYLASTPTSAPAATPPAPAPVSSAKGQQALAYARKQLGKSYEFGSAGPNTFDCSGLTVAAWRAAGVNLQRTSQTQFTSGERIAKADLRPGDLVFFYGKSPTHVAIYAGNGEVIHSPRPGKTVAVIKMAYMPYAGAVRPA